MVAVLIIGILTIAILLTTSWARADAGNITNIGGPDSKVYMKSDTNLLFTSGGGHIEWTISGPVTSDLKKAIDNKPRDGDVSSYEANVYIDKVDLFIEGTHPEYEGAKVLRTSLMNHQITTDTSGLIAKVNDTGTISINFIYDSAPIDDNAPLQLSNAIFVHALFAVLGNSTMSYHYVGEVEIRHVNTIVGLESYVMPGSPSGHVTHYVLPLVDYYDYSLKYSGDEFPPAEKEDWGEAKVFDPMTNTVVILVVLIILWVLIVNAPKWFASYYNKKAVFGLRGGLFGLIAINFIVYVLAWRYWMLYGIAGLLLILSAVLSYAIYGRSKLAKDLETPGKAAPEVPAAQPKGPAEVQPMAPATDDGAVDDFDIEEIFYIYKDGRVITHCSIQSCDSVIEKDVVGSMLVAIHEFVSASFRKEGQLDGFQFGDSKIVVMTGNHGHLVIVLSGAEPPFLRDRMAEVVQKIEGMYAGIIEDWDGDKNKFHGINAMIEPLFDIKRGVKIKPSPEVVHVKSALEFYEGYLRLKIGIVNERKTSITDVVFRLSFEKTALSLSHVDPAYPMDGSAVLLGVIAPGEKKSLTFYLDPLTCQVTNIDGSATYRDFKGQFQTAVMKRRPAEIVCPIFMTPSTINVAMLKRLRGDLPYKDSRVFELGSSVDYRKVYGLSRDAVLAHNIKLVKEFITPQPYYGEGWFYAQTVETKEEMIIKLLVDQGRGVAQLWVASNNLATLTGLIAEVGSAAARKIQETLGLTAMPMPSANAKLKESLESGGVKLDTFQAEGEAAPTDGGPRHAA